MKQNNALQVVPSKGEHFYAHLGELVGEDRVLDELRAREASEHESERLTAIWTHRD